MTEPRCIGEPVSWLRLEELALGVARAGVADHVAACPACQRGLDDIRGDVVALPPLAAIASRRRRSWWWLAAPALAAAAAVLVLVLRPRPEQRDAIRGGDVVIGTVRERGGAIRDDVFTFAPGDRFKVVVTCPPRFQAWVDVAVVEDGAATADYPLAPAAIACGNRVVLPGAFSLTGARPNRVCVRVGSGAAPPRTLPDADDACVTLRPE